MTVLFIFAHPDDETIFSGGMISRHVEKGDRVILVSASSGEKGDFYKKRLPLLFYVVFKWFGAFPYLINIQKPIIKFISIFRKPDKELAKIRENEARKAASVYEIANPVFLGVPDMRFEKYKKKIEKNIKGIISRLKPKLVYILHPNSLTGHPDHQVLSKSVLEVIRGIPATFRPKVMAVAVPRDKIRKHKLPLIGVSANKIDITVELTEQEFQKKLRAIKAYKSQKYLWEIFLKKSPEILKKEYFLKLD